MSSVGGSIPTRLLAGLRFCAPPGMQRRPPVVSVDRVAIPSYSRECAWTVKIADAAILCAPLSTRRLALVRLRQFQQRHGRHARGSPATI